MQYLHHIAASSLEWTAHEGRLEGRETVNVHWRAGDNMNNEAEQSGWWMAVNMVPSNNLRDLTNCEI